MNRVHLIFTLCLAVAVMLLPAFSSDATAGVLGCGGSSIALSGGTAGNQVYTIYQFTNFNDTGTISIDRIVLYGEEGAVLCDFSSAKGFPPGMQPVLGPHASTSVVSLNLPCVPPPSYPGGALSAVVYWSFTSRGEGNSLRGSTIEQIRDVATNQHQGRSSEACRDVRLK